jgi:hypothetical protein
MYHGPEPAGMEGDETRTTVSSRTGFLSMFGGASLLFGFGGLGLLESGTGAAAASGAFFGAAVALYVLLAPGAAGLYYRHRATFGWPGVVGVAVLLVGLLSNGVNGLAPPAWSRWTCVRRIAESASRSMPKSASAPSTTS